MMGYARCMDTVEPKLSGNHPDITFTRNPRRTTRVTFLHNRSGSRSDFQSARIGEQHSGTCHALCCIAVHADGFARERCGVDSVSGKPVGSLDTAIELNLGIVSAPLNMHKATNRNMLSATLNVDSFAIATAVLRCICCSSAIVDETKTTRKPLSLYFLALV